MSYNEYQRFIWLLRLAYEASDLVDRFDLHSEDPKSAAEFAALCDDQHETFKRLLEHVGLHRDKILADADTGRRLDRLVEAAIQGNYYTADGERVMLPIQSLVDMGLVDASAVNRLKQRLDAWNAANLIEGSQNGA